MTARSELMENSQYDPKDGPIREGLGCMFICLGIAAIKELTERHGGKIAHR